jgi:glycosyltransferase involved in cell wall biosynthesis
VRILIWHGWLLEGSGSNVVTARTAEVFRASGHDVLLLCQDRHPDRFAWIDAHGTLAPGAPPELTPNPGATRGAPGRCVLLRPEIGSILPVFVLDPYEGFDEVRRFVDLSDAELADYLDRNVAALRAAADRHDPDVAIMGHGIPGGVLGRRALGPGRYVAKIHGSDLEYAIRPQRRYRDLAREGLESAHAVVGPTRETLDRCATLVPEMQRLARVVPPGVDVGAFHPMSRTEALLDVASRLDRDLDPAHGRPTSIDEDVERSIAGRDLQALDALADRYQHDVPEPEAPVRLRRLAAREEPIVGYLGKLIPQKGVELLVQALAGLGHEARGLIVGFGSARDRLAALVSAIERDDRETLAWLGDAAGIPIDLAAIGGPTDPRPDVTFTGMLDHRYAPGALAAMDVQVVPSILPEAFGIVAAEGAAAGALPLVARHSGLAEVADSLEDAVGRSGLFSFEPGAGAVGRLATGIDRLLSLPHDERAELGSSVSAFVRTHWTWERTAAGLLEAAALPG